MIGVTLGIIVIKSLKTGSGVFFLQQHMGLAY